MAAGAGALVGGVVAALPSGWSAPNAGFFFVGASVGLVCGPVVQTVNIFVVHRVFRIGPAMPPVAVRLALVPIPALGAGGVVLALFGTTFPVALMVAVLLSVSLAWVLAPWCLLPGSTIGAWQKQ